MIKQSYIAKIEQVASCFSFISSGQKREYFVGFYETKRKNAPSLLDLLKRATQSLNLEIGKIVGGASMVSLTCLASMLISLYLLYYPLKFVMNWFN